MGIYIENTQTHNFMYELVWLDQSGHFDEVWLFLSSFFRVKVNAITENVNNIKIIVALNAENFSN